MFCAQGSYRNHCSLLAVICGKISDEKQKQTVSEAQPSYPFPELVSSGRLEVTLLKSPDVNEFRRVLEASEFNFVYLQGLQLEGSEEVGPLVWGNVDLSAPEALCSVFGSALPTTVYLEIPNAEKAAEALHSKDTTALGSLEDGIYSLLSIECSSTSSSSRDIFPGSSDNALLENHVKNELIENSQLVRVLPNSEGSNMSLSEPRKSASTACGAGVFEVCVKVPAWASQVLRQLAPDISYRSLVALGIASIQGVPVASFEKEDAERLLFFSSQQGKEFDQNNFFLSSLPRWLKPPLPSRKLSEPATSLNLKHENGGNNSKRRVMNVAPMRPIPRAHHKMVPFYGFIPEAERHEGAQATQPIGPMKHNLAGPSVTHRRSSGNSLQAQQILSLNPLPLKKHGCGRSPIQSCSEEEFLRDVMEFLILRGHTRLVPQSGLEEFPDAVLNAKRLDLFNLYKEGVGNTLKRHYETYLLEYELAHDDVDGECCLLCHSSAPGDWVNCGMCGEWAHFGCDRRQGLGAFKDYAKTDGLEYICPHCSVSNFRKKSQKTTNGY
ncbi:hypothetical protein CDL15_Pgr013248 [Punica granatum]|uniref:ARID domain-containing protein n=1 Tax=Punica granatum TaxID=22663 RepID=A0A218WNC5_PUNGR|nr:hypothetical protein CDL15_Pgr013248 [Punica granatum]